MADSDRRRSAATATVGLSGVGGAAALRHEALVRSYEERSKKPVKRPRLASELRMLDHAKGRRVWLGGATLGAVSLPAAATGVHGLLHPKQVAAKRDDSFWREGVSGARDAVIDRTQTASTKAPPKLVAGNYAAGALIGSATGGLTHHALRHKKIPGHGKSALAATIGATAGTAMLPLQSKLTSRYSRGKYEVTPTGVRRAKKAPRRASSKATVVEGRPGKITMHPMAVREQMGPVDKSYIGNGQWVSASHLRQAATTDHMFPASKHKVTALLRGKHQQTPGDAKGRTIWPEALKTKRGQLQRVTMASRQAERHGLLGYSKPDGRGGGELRAYRTPGVSTQETVRHEEAHIAPRRNPHRMRERLSDDLRRGREEGRADYLASSRPTPGKYPGGPRFQQGYDEVQGKMGRVHKGPVNNAGAKLGAKWTVNGLRLADKIDAPAKAVPKTRKGRLVRTGRTKLANTTRSVSFDVGSINDKDALARNAVHGNPLFDDKRYTVAAKREYLGQDMTHGQKRARVMAAGTAPIVGDFAAAGTAASLAPPELRKKTAALQFGGSMGGQVAGGAAGAYGLVHAAKHPKVRAGVDRTNAALDAGSSAVRSRLGLKPKTGKGVLTRVAEHAKTPSVVRGALRPLTHNPKVAALGVLAGGMAGSTAGGWGGYGHALKLEDRRNAARKHSTNPTARSGFGKRAGRILTQDEHKKQAHKKKIAANVATFTGITGTGALGALGGSKLLHARGAVKAAEKVRSVQVPLLTAGAGVGGVGSFNFAGIQRKEAKAEQAQSGVKKALVPRAPGIRRAPSIRRAAIRQTRYPGGAIRTSTVRGGLA